jgi:hypothetical protein
VKLILYRLAANMILVLHTMVVLFAVLGGLLIMVDVRMALVHLPVVVWSSVVNLAHWTCPLTPLEQWLRLRAGQTSFSGGWIQHYLEPVVRPLGMPRTMELVAGISVIVWNLVVYGLIHWIFGFDLISGRAW